MPCADFGRAIGHSIVGRLLGKGCCTLLARARLVADFSGGSLKCLGCLWAAGLAIIIRIHWVLGFYGLSSISSKLCAIWESIPDYFQIVRCADLII